MNFSSITNFSLSASWDWIIVLAFVAVALIYGLSMGRNRLVIIILGTYFSFLLVNYFPWQFLDSIDLKQTPTSTIQIFLFLAIILAFYFLIPHSALGSALKLRGRGRANWWQSLLLSFVQIGLILSIITGFLPENISSGISPFAKIIFVGDLARFLWLLLPIVAIMFLRKRGYEIAD